MMKRGENLAESFGAKSQTYGVQALPAPLCSDSIRRGAGSQDLPNSSVGPLADILTISHAEYLPKVTRTFSFHRGDRTDRGQRSLSGAQAQSMG